MDKEEHNFRRTTVVFDCGDEGRMIVYRICPECGSYLKKGKLFTNPFMEKTRFEGWVCKRHGEVKPAHFMD